MVRNANERPDAPVSSPAMNQVSDSWSSCNPSAAGKSSALSPDTSRNGYLRQSVFMSHLWCLDRVVLVEQLVVQGGIDVLEAIGAGVRHDADGVVRSHPKFVAHVAFTVDPRQLPGGPSFLLC